MSDLSVYTKNMALAAGGMNPIPTNNPERYEDRQRQYFDPETRRFIQSVARYASDFMVTQVQGINESEPYAWETYRMRFTDVVRPSSAIQRHFDDYKQFLFESAKIEYVRPGTKIVTMGNTWLVTNPANVSGASGSGICRRCNAVWNFLDYYGNVVSEPIIVENERANANDSDTQNSQYITKGYFNVICQYNEYTRQINTNTRMILGTGAYRVTGYSDFETEFTGDYSTVRLLSFSVRYEEPNDAIDDMVNHVAEGKTFAWDLSVSGQSSMRVGAETQLTVTSVRNGETVSSTQENPISYLYESSDESVIAVDGSGFVTATGEGSATVRVRMAQNEAIHTNFAVTVTESADGVKFTSTVPKQLPAYSGAGISAAYFEDGTETDEPLTWTLTGGSETAYSAIISTDGKTVSIDCFGYSEEPLTVTASYGSYSASAEIVLEGF